MKITNYLWDKKVLISLFAVCTIVTGSIIYMSENKSLLESNGFYSILLTLLLFTIYMAADYLKMNFHCRKLKTLFNSHETDWIVLVPSPYTSEQKLYTELLIKHLWPDKQAYVECLSYGNTRPANLLAASHMVAM